MVTAYYNEIDPFASAWLKELIKAGHIAPGEVDTRSIEDVTAADLRGFTQCHFFAGIGVWSYALRCAGWPDDRPVWTGSCPCQPFSTAGKRGGCSDERHLWPAWFHLIEICRPSTVFGEQVVSKDGLSWLDLVHADLEGSGYAVGALDLCAAGFGAPHIRNRLYFVAESEVHRRGEGIAYRSGSGKGNRETGSEQRIGNDGPARLVADASDERQRSGGAGRDSDEREFVEGSEQGRDGVNDGPARLVADSEHDGHDRPAGLAPEPLRDEPGQRILDGDCGARLVADAEYQGRDNRGNDERGRDHHPDQCTSSQGSDGNIGRVCPDACKDSNPRLVAHADLRGRQQQPSCEPAGIQHEAAESPECLRSVSGHGASPCHAARGELGDTELPGLQGGERLGEHPAKDRRGPQGSHGATCEPICGGPCNGFWRNAVWLPCRDGKARPTEPGLFPLAHGAADRVGRLRGYGNAIVAPVAEEFIRAYMHE